MHHQRSSSAGIGSPCAVLLALTRQCAYHGCSTQTTRLLRQSIITRVIFAECVAWLQEMCPGHAMFRVHVRDGQPIRFITQEAEDVCHLLALLV